VGVAGAKDGPRILKQFTNFYGVLCEFANPLRVGPGLFRATRETGCSNSCQPSNRDILSFASVTFTSPYLHKDRQTAGALTLSL